MRKMFTLLMMAIVVAIALPMSAVARTRHHHHHSRVAAVLRPQNVVKPSISGDVSQGSTLTAHQGRWIGVRPMSFVFTWQDCGPDGCFDIAAGKTYTLQSSDVGLKVRVRVTASNRFGARSAFSNWRGPVSGTTPPPPPPPGVQQWAICNQSSQSNATVQAWGNAVADDYNKNFAPKWSLQTITPVYTCSDNSAYYAMNYVVDSIGVVGAAGYHTYGPGSGCPLDNQPCSFNLAQYGSSVLDHEMKEIGGDPTVDVLVRAHCPECGFSDNDTVYFLREASDPVQDTGYSVDGQEMNNHVLLSWFQRGSAGPWDQLGVLHSAQQTTSPNGQEGLQHDGVWYTFSNPSGAKVAFGGSHPNLRRLAHRPGRVLFPVRSALVAMHS